MLEARWEHSPGPVAPHPQGSTVRWTEEAGSLWARALLELLQQYPCPLVRVFKIQESPFCARAFC